MCGICGLVHADKEVQADVAVLERMNSRLTHRGPEEGGAWCQGHAGLAMRRLSIIDLEGGHQPMVSDDGGLVLVFNGEIYNFRELRAELEKLGHQFHTRSDTEVALRAWEAWGDAALDRFNGMFGLAAYDTRRERLVLARDRLGIKPLFYTMQKGALLFASELDALLHSGCVAGKVEPGALDAYLSFLYIPAPDTIFHGVHKLRPGEKLVFEKGRESLETWWAPRFSHETPWKHGDAVAYFYELFAESVQLRRVSDVPLGAFLSGGIDSSAVVAMLSTMDPMPAKTFTIGFDDAHADEVAFARKVARHFGTDHTEEILKPDLAAAAGGLARYFGEPFADSSAVPTWLVSKLARQQVTVALSGDGGDELFAGYTWLHMARRVGTYRRAPAPLRRLLDTALRIAPDSPLAGKVRRFSADSFLAPMEGFRRRQTCFDPAARAALYQPDIAQGVVATARDRFGEHADAAAGLPDDDAMLHQDLRMYLPDDVLTKVDRMSMAHALEVRTPLLDHRLVEFAATLPFEWKYRRGRSKLLLKQAMGKQLPNDIMKQRKQGFAIPIHRWFRGELRSHFEETALDGARLARWLRPEPVRDLLERHAAGRENEGHRLWALLMLEHWLRYVETIPGFALEQT